MSISRDIVVAVVSWRTCPLAYLGDGTACSGRGGKGRADASELLGDAQALLVRRHGFTGLDRVQSGVKLAEDPQGVGLAVSAACSAHQLEQPSVSKPLPHQSAAGQVAFAGGPRGPA